MPRPCVNRNYMRRLLEAIGFLTIYLAALAATVVGWMLCVSTIKGHWSLFTLIFAVGFLAVLIGFPLAYRRR